MTEAAKASSRATPNGESPAMNASCTVPTWPGAAGSVRPMTFRSSTATAPATATGTSTARRLNTTQPRTATHCSRDQPKIRASSRGAPIAQPLPERFESEEGAGSREDCEQHALERTRHHRRRLDRLGRGIDERQGSSHVVVVIEKRLLDRLSNRLQAGKVHHGVEAMSVEYLSQGASVTDVDLREARPPPGDSLEPIEYGHLAVAKIVDNENIVA